MSKKQTVFNLLFLVIVFGLTMYLVFRGKDIGDIIRTEMCIRDRLYVESLSKPMPFFIGVPVAEGNKMKINWDNSYSFDAEDITYSVEIAKDYLFQDVIYTQDGLMIPETELELPEAGQYFIRVRATNEKMCIRDRMYMLSLAVFVPVWGPVCVLLIHFQLFSGTDQVKTVGIEKLRVNEEIDVYKRQPWKNCMGCLCESESPL